MVYIFFTINRRRILLDATAEFNFPSKTQQKTRKKHIKGLKEKRGLNKEREEEILKISSEKIEL